MLWMLIAIMGSVSLCGRMFLKASVCEKQALSHSALFARLLLSDFVVLIPAPAQREGLGENCLDGTSG
jgi:hypothetical protein